MAQDTSYENYELKITRLEEKNTILDDVTKLGLWQKAGVIERNETLWHKTKGDADYKTHEGNGECSGFG